MEFEFKKAGAKNKGSAVGQDKELEACLGSDNFDVKQFVRDVAQSYDSAQEWNQHKKRVQALADRTAQQLKQNVFKNYVPFIDSSKEISSLEAEMYQLGHSLHEQSILTKSLQALTVSESKSAIQDMERAEKQEQQHSISFLLETVEGGAIVTEVPDRYLIHSGRLYELDRETYRELGEVKAFLLNDSLMTAVPVSKRKGPVKYKFQSLYELDNMAIVDIKDCESLTMAFKILMFPDSHLYQTETEEDKRNWIKVLEGTKRKRKEEVDAEKKEALERSRSETVESTILSTSMRAFQMATPTTPVSVEKKQADMLNEEWLKDVPETLDVFIEQREFEQAVDLILSTKTFLKDMMDSHALRDVRARLNHRINRLSSVLMKELEASPSGSLRGGPRAARRAVKFLIQFGRSAKACTLFLENYRQIIERDLSDVKMEDSLNLFATNFATTFFMGLRNAAIEFERAFDKNYGSYSSFIVWCNNLLKYFSQKSAKVIFSSSNNKSSTEGSTLSTVTDCILSTMKECDSLNNIGLDLTFALWDLYHPFLIQVCISVCARVCVCVFVYYIVHKHLPELAAGKGTRFVCFIHSFIILLSTCLSNYIFYLIYLLYALLSHKSQ